MMNELMLQLESPSLSVSCCHSSAARRCGRCWC